jgi:hypothetical protein
VVGDRGAVSKCRIPFSAQIRSNITSADDPAGPNRPVNTFPLFSQNLLWAAVPAQRRQ